MHVGKYVLPLSLMVLLFGCAQTVTFRAAPGAPAALGAAKVSTDNNGNAVVDVEVEHLAPPENLFPPKTLYVVWAQTPNGRFVNLGQMVVGKKPLINNREKSRVESTWIQPDRLALLGCVILSGVSRASAF